MLLKDAHCDECKFFEDLQFLFGCHLKDKGIVTADNVVLNERGIVEHCERFRSRRKSF